MNRDLDKPTALVPIPNWRATPIAKFKDFPARLRNGLIHHTEHRTLGDLADAIANDNLTQTSVTSHPGIGRKSWGALAWWYSQLPAITPSPTTKPSPRRPASPKKLRSTEAIGVPAAILALRENRLRIRQGKIRAEERRQHDLELAQAEEQRLAAVALRKEKRVARREREAAARDRAIEPYLAGVRANLLRELDLAQSGQNEAASRKLFGWSTLAYLAIMMAFAVGGFALNQTPHRGDISGNIVGLVFLVDVAVLWFWFMETIEPFVRKTKDATACQSNIERIVARLEALDAKHYDLKWVGRSYYSRSGWGIDFVERNGTVKGEDW